LVGSHPVAAALASSIGTAASVNLDPLRKSPSIFEPVHGSAFDIMGKGIANPIGAILALADLLAWVGLQDLADVVIAAVVRTCKEGQVTRDVGGKFGTEAVSAAICGLLRN